MSAGAMDLTFVGTKDLANEVGILDGYIEE